MTYPILQLHSCSDDDSAQVLLFDDLVIDIFQRLPVKSVLRFMCLSKHWCSILKSDNFIENHFRKQKKMLLMRRCLPLPEFEYHDKDDVFSFHDLDSPEVEIRPSLSIAFFRDPLVGGEPMARKMAYVVNFVGCCNGIVCIKYGPQFLFCNPALPEFNQLPDQPSILPHIHVVNCGVAYGFGVANGNDFKVIAMHTYYDKTSVTAGTMNRTLCVMVNLYSSRTKSWRRLGDAPVMPKNLSVENYIILNGACHWLGRTFGNFHKTVLCFDIEYEVFRRLELPDSLCRHETDDAIPIILNDGCFGLLELKEWLSKSEPVEVWGMKEYGVKESWTKLFVISPQPIARNFSPWKNDILMVYEPMYDLPEEQWHQLLDEKLNCQLTSYSLQTNQVKYFPVYGLQNTMVMVEYTESLVSLKE